jgi:ATP-dependent Lon protease
MDDLRKQVDEYVSASDEIPDEATFALHNINNNVMALNFVCTNMPFSTKEKMKLLGVESMKERLMNAIARDEEFDGKRKTQKQYADEFGVTERTIRSYLKEIDEL